MADFPKVLRSEEMSLTLKTQPPTWEPARLTSGHRRLMWRRPVWPTSDGPTRAHVASHRGEVQRNRAHPHRNLFASTLFVFVLAALLPASAAPWTIRTQPARLLNGAPVLFQVKPPARLDSLSGSWLGHQIVFSFNPSTKTWFALAGVSFETAPGPYVLNLTGESATTKAPLKLSRTLRVARARYPEIKAELTVEKKFTEPSPEQLKEIDESKKIKDEFLPRVTLERQWDGNFTAPVEAPTSDVYGSRRIFNGVAQREHQGLDYRVHTGTPVAAMNRGTILLARFLYYEGNCVAIDHGQGLLTLYFHLSELKAKEGDTVKRGELIGLSGGTGRATGPHLHVAVRWQGTYLDPAKLMQLSLP